MLEEAAHLVFVRDRVVGEGRVDLRERELLSVGQLHIVATSRQVVGP